MPNLRLFIQNDYPLLKAQLESIQNLLEEIWTALEKFETEGHWPYLIEAASAKPSSSSSTRCMVAYALACTLGTQCHSKAGAKFRPLFAYQERESPKKSGQKPTEDNISIKLTECLKRVCAKLNSDSNKKADFANSKTFGHENPFSLSWAFLTSGSKLGKKQIEIINNKISKWENDPGMLLDIAPPKRKPEKGEERTAEDHAFVSLTWLHLWKATQEERKNKDSQYKIPSLDKKVSEYFKKKLNEQITNYSLKNGLFDAGELIFSLEGFLLTEHPRPFVDFNLLETIIQCLEESQKTSPYWRPIKPLITSVTGATHLPLSIEIVNSLLRICHILDSGSQPFKFFRQCQPLLNRYYEWLRSRIKRGETNGKIYCGWSSEHTCNEDGIHAWETSQVALFLHGFNDLTQRELSNLLLELSGINVKTDPRPDVDWVVVGEKEHLQVNIEPVKNLKCYIEIFLKYILPRLDRHSQKEASWSMLLFGPPGTGKTTVCETIAYKLGWKLIQLSPSDFIAEGESQVEARAKDIFKVLNEQFESVILFDEIDQLLLERSSKYFAAQNNFFQFMTPGMLVKLNDLRELERSIFVISTNYEERIDSAIKRTGRVDEKYLIMPPDLEQRKLRIRSGVKNRTLSEEQIAICAKGTVLMSHSELTRFGKTLPEKLPIDENWYPSGSPTISLQAYSSRIESPEDGEKVSLLLKPVAEFLWLSYLIWEAGGLNSQDRTLLKKLLGEIEAKPSLTDRLRRFGVTNLAPNFTKYLETL